MMGNWNEVSIGCELQALTILPRIRVGGLASQHGRLLVWGTK